MSTALELVYEYRHLLGKCQGGAGLSMDEIEAVEAIEELFRNGSAPSQQPSQNDATPGTANGNGLGDGNGLGARLAATLRGGPHKLCDKVRLVSAHLDHFVVEVSAFTEPGAVVELAIEDDELRLSYRFKTRVHSLAEDSDHEGQQVILALIGAPLLVRRGPRRPRIDQKSLPPRPSSEPRVVAD